MKKLLFGAIMIFSVMTINSCDKASSTSNMLEDAYDYHNKYKTSVGGKLKGENLGTALIEVETNLKDQINDEEKLNKKYPANVAFSEDSLKKVLTLESRINSFSICDSGEYGCINIDEGSGKKQIETSRNSYSPDNFKTIQLLYKGNGQCEINIEDIGYNPIWKVALDWDLLKTDKTKKRNYVKDGFYEGFVGETPNHAICSQDPTKVCNYNLPVIWYKSVSRCKGGDFGDGTGYVYEALIKNRILISISSSTDENLIKDVILKAFNWEYIKTL